MRSTMGEPTRPVMFVFTPGKETTQTTIQKSNTNLLMEAARRIDEWQILAKRIPSTRLVPVFTEQTATTSVSLTPQEWQEIESYLMTGRKQGWSLS